MDAGQSIARSSPGRRARPLIAVALTALVFPLAAAATAGPTGPASAVQDPVACPPATVELTNAGFEDPSLGSAPTFRELPMEDVPGWKTTDARGQIEFWSNGYLGVPAGAGTQFAEINASGVGTLYQEVSTTPGQTLGWSLLHRSRQGTDVMAVYIGAPGAEVLQDTISDDFGTGWMPHSGLYTVPDGQTTTRFGFSAVSTGSGNPSIGNFIDEITFGTSPCVVLSAAGSNTDGRDPALVGDTIRYTLSATNYGGSAAQHSLLTNPIPAGMAYAPGSLTVTVNGAPVSATDAAGDDAAEYDAAVASVRYRLGVGATAAEGGTIDPGGTVTVSFAAVPTDEAGGTTVIDAASLVYTGPASATPRTATSNDVPITVADAVPTTPPTTPVPTASPAVPAAAGGDSAGSLAVTGGTGGMLPAMGLLLAAGAVLSVTSRVRRRHA